MRSGFYPLTTGTPATPPPGMGAPKTGSRFPYTVLKSKENAVSQEKEGQGQEKQSSPWREGRLGDSAARPGCTQAGGQGHPSLDRDVQVPKESWLLYRQDRGLVSRTALPPPPGPQQDAGAGA